MSLPTHEEIEAVLKPIAAALEYMDPDRPDYYDIWEDPVALDLYVGDLKALLALYRRIHKPYIAPGEI